MRISDWSSDVCSSDLHRPGAPVDPEDRAVVQKRLVHGQPRDLTAGEADHQVPPHPAEGSQRGLGDRKSVVKGKSVSVRVDLGCRRMIKQKNSYAAITDLYREQ